ncbi:hypothetical protein [Massilia sp. TWP1-3-3]|uniref:hypothetical protein n=1 Tax=Massilia sp. TWP1-3-3 TaxID=2804573 RepID=UPI003CF156FF
MANVTRQREVYLHIGHPGGWSVILKLGTQEKPLCVQRTDKPRMWRSLDRCVEYLKRELRIARFELLDATNHSDVAVAGVTSRADAATRLRNAHEAAGHDKWFREEVGQAIAEADDPSAEWVTNDEANTSWATKQAALVKRFTANAV